MSKVRSPVIPCDTVAATAEGPARDVSVAAGVAAAVAVSAGVTRGQKLPCPAPVTGSDVSSRGAELQVRDNAQRTRFVLVWNGIDGAWILATSQTFRTIRDAMTEGFTRFGILPVRRR